MERRRRLLGLKKPGSITEESVSKLSNIESGGSSKPKSTDNITAKGKTPQRSPAAGSVTPKQMTPRCHNNVTPLKSESPCSPLKSSNCQMMFFNTLGSPEIEVSWDWSCSQVPKDMLPPKRVRRVNQVQPQLPAIPTINICSRLPPQRQMTEEENQQRLQFYKNILSKSLKSDSKTSADSRNNNVEELSSPDISKPFTTPKRSSRLSLSSKKKDEQINSLFDDSANEFMFECSQAIEEKLQNGEIRMGPIVDIKIKRSLSSGEEKGNCKKKLCHGRVNLFPENLKNEKLLDENKVKRLPVLSQLPTSTNNSLKLNQNCGKKVEDDMKIEDNLKNAILNVDVDTSSKSFRVQTSSSNESQVNKVEVNALPSCVVPSNMVQKPFINYNSQNIERRPLLTKSVQPTSNPISNNRIITSHCVNGEVFKKSVNISTYNNVDQFCKPQNGNVLCNNNYSLIKPPNDNENMLRNHTDLKSVQNPTTSLPKESQRPLVTLTSQEQSSKDLDVTSLLDDDFDVELSCLDVDSICRSNGNKQPQNLSITHSAPKLCTQREIEAKRLAALQKLMTKKKR